MLDGILGPKLSAAEEELVTSKRVIFMKHEKWPRRKWVRRNNRVESRLERHFLSRGLHSSPRLGKLQEVSCV